jgi:hypothetical protein
MLQWNRGQRIPSPTVGPLVRGPTGRGGFVFSKRPRKLGFVRVGSVCFFIWVRSSVPRSLVGFVFSKRPSKLGFVRVGSVCFFIWVRSSVLRSLVGFVFSKRPSSLGSLARVSCGSPGFVLFEPEVACLSPFFVTQLTGWVRFFIFGRICESIDAKAAFTPLGSFVPAAGSAAFIQRAVARRSLTFAYSPHDTRGDPIFGAGVRRVCPAADRMSSTCII